MVEAEEVETRLTFDELHDRVVDLADRGNVGADVLNFLQRFAYFSEPLVCLGKFVENPRLSLSKAAYHQCLIDPLLAKLRGRL